MSARHVMLDLETLGTRPGCVVLSIGAVKFDAEAGPAEPLSVNVDIQSALDAGLTVHGGTIRWWLEQTDAARRRLLTPAPVALHGALKTFSNWFSGSTYVWSHGATFDIPILEAAYVAVGQRAPWSYRDARDTRTLFHLVPEAIVKVEDNGVAHCALDDAERQARQVQAAVRFLRRPEAAS